MKLLPSSARIAAQTNVALIERAVEGAEKRFRLKFEKLVVKMRRAHELGIEQESRRNVYC